MKSDNNMRTNNHERQKKNGTYTRNAGTIQENRLRSRKITNIVRNREAQENTQRKLL